MASPKHLFGWELEFSNAKVRNANYGTVISQANATNDAAREKWYKVVKKLCAETGDCRAKEIEGWVSWRRSDGYPVWSWEIASYRFTFGDGFWFQLSYDTGTVEVQLKPSSAEELRKNAARLQKYVFDSAAKVGLKPPVGEETHIHIGADAAFGLDLHLVRNFLVDGINHPEWSFLFAKILDSAPPLVMLPRQKYAKLAEIVAEVDSGEITETEEFIRQVRKKVYDVTYEEAMLESEDNVAQKFQQWNVERMRKKFKDGEKTIENRAVPHPANAADVVDLTALQDARVNYVLSLGRKKIALRPFAAKLPLEEQVARFRAYVTESGLDFDQYKRFLRKSCERVLRSKQW